MTHVDERLYCTRPTEEEAAKVVLRLRGSGVTADIRDVRFMHNPPRTTNRYAVVITNQGEQT